MPKQQRAITLMYLLHLLTLTPAFGQYHYNDLYFAELKGEVKSVLVTTKIYDTTSYNFGTDKRIETHYNNNGNCSVEFEYLDTVQIQKRVSEYVMVNGWEKRIRKVTTHAIDSANKTTTYYHFDETGFDTTIVVCDLDSSYHILYKHKKNDRGLRVYCVEYNAKSGNKNYSYEVAYTQAGQPDTVIYKNGGDVTNYSEYYQYDESGNLVRICYSDGGCSLFKYFDFDPKGNWLVAEIYFAKDDKIELLSKRLREIAYY